VGKLGVFLVALMMMGTVKCYGADLSSLPFVTTRAAPPSAPAYVAAISTPAAVQLPEIDFTKWFTAEATADAPADAYHVTTWQQVDSFVAVARTQAGWTEACKKAAAAAGAGRATNAEVGILACSADPSVTPIQQFAVGILGTRAEVALWIRGVPGHSVGGIAGRQGELRLACAVDVIAREGGADSAYAQACKLALATAYVTGDGKATFDALGEAYKLVAAEVAKRDPKIASEPAYFPTGGEKKK